MLLLAGTIVMGALAKPGVAGDAPAPTVVQKRPGANWRLKRDEPLVVRVGVETAQLTLKRQMLVSEKASNGAGGQLRRIWAIALSADASELVFRPNGELVILDEDQNVIWRSIPAARSARTLFSFSSTGAAWLEEPDRGKVWEQPAETRSPTN